MSDATGSAAHPPLGFGDIIGESFRIFFSRLLTVIVLGCVPGLISMVVKGVFLGFGPALLDPAIAFESAGVGLGVLGIVIDMVAYGLMMALLVQMAYDAKLNKTRPVSAYFSPALRVAFPVALLAIIVGIAAGIAMLALIVPGLWLYAVLSVTIPVAVIERAGLGSMGRSASLTKEYRWPVLGTLVVMGILTMIVGGVIGFITAFPAALGLPVGGVIVLVVLATGVSYGLSAITSALIYARLREIKEGVHVDELASVFD